MDIRKAEYIEQGIDDLSNMVDLISSSDPEILEDPATMTEIQTQFNAGKSQINANIQELLSGDDPPPKDKVELWDQQILSLDLEFYRYLYR